ncbi:MAG: glycosyltransferase family 1 protein [Actinomycetaceae bacterium]|nr:glycosyltransferase family 1 protein [Actinomycetaceae bacterium]
MSHAQSFPSPLKIGMVVEQLFQPVPGGSGRYIVELTQALSGVDEISITGLSAKHKDYSALGPIPYRAFPWPRQVLYETWRRLSWPRVESKVPDLDLVHATTWAIPATRLPLVVTVHDLAFLKDPSHFTRHGVSFFKDAWKRTLDLAAAVIVPSEATGDHCIHEGLEPERLHVIEHGVAPNTATEAEVEAFRRDFGIRKDFIMWCGTFEPRKNLSTVLKSYELIAGDYPEVDLVLIGPKGWGDSGINIPAPLMERIHLTGKVTDAQLQAAYKAARLFTFPSIWEGFGLPVLEAMAAGTPVISAANTSMAEVMGDTGFLVDALDAQGQAEAVGAILEQDKDSLGSLGLQRAKGFTWDAAAQQHIEVYKKVAARA